jgi:hypothetical protein
MPRPPHFMAPDRDTTAGITTGLAATGVVTTDVTTGTEDLLNSIGEGKYSNEIYYRIASNGGHIDWLRRYDECTTNVRLQRRWGRF